MKLKYILIISAMRLAGNDTVGEEPKLSIIQFNIKCT